MSPKLKPLILPQLVEERRKLEVQQSSIGDGEQTLSYSAQNSSSSDITSLSPATPTFSRSGHSRCSGSVSSLDLAASSCADSPASPSQAVHSSASKACLSPLPDLQEDPLEREDEEITVLPDHFAFGDCFCDDQALTEDVLMAQSAIHSYTLCDDIDYDLGFLSENDGNDSPRQKRKREGSVSSFSAWGTRIGSRFPTLSRWKSTRKSKFAFPGSDPCLDQRFTISRAASSRSSSISAPGRHVPDRSNEPPLPETPALSMFESRESIALPEPLDIEKANLRASLERERSMATTPLLPPLMTEKIALSQVPSLQPSPLQSPAILVPLSLDTSVPPSYLTPPLSTKASISSFPRGTMASPDLPSPIHNLLDHGDSWSDRLGHANFTILPKPYAPATANVQALVAFREDWDLARVNYTNHLMRTGEHYGATSKTYAMTQAKWAEIEREWLAMENTLVERLTAEGNGDTIAALQLRQARDDVALIPKILKDAEGVGKFPERGDVDIVGPMVRDVIMVRPGFDEKKTSTTTWFRNLAEKMGLRR